MTTIIISPIISSKSILQPVAFRNCGLFSRLARKDTLLNRQVEELSLPANSIDKV